MKKKKKKKFSMSLLSKREVGRRKTSTTRSVLFQVNESSYLFYRCYRIFINKLQLASKTLIKPYKIFSCRGANKEEKEEIKPVRCVLGSRLLESS
jgi:hypothetical protein